MLGMKKPDIKAEALKKREKLLARAQEMRKLTLNPDSGWTEFMGILEDYTQACMKRKALTALDIASDKEIYELKLLDHEIYILQWVKNIPMKIFSAEEDMLKKVRDKEKQNKIDRSEQEE